MTELDKDKFRQWWYHFIGTHKTMTVDDVLGAIRDLETVGQVQEPAPHIDIPAEDTSL